MDGCANPSVCVEGEGLESAVRRQAGVKSAAAMAAGARRGSEGHREA